MYVSTVPPRISKNSEIACGTVREERKTMANVRKSFFSLLLVAAMMAQSVYGAETEVSASAGATEAQQETQAQAVPETQTVETEEVQEQTEAKASEISTPAAPASETKNHKLESTEAKAPEILASETEAPETKSSETKNPESKFKETKASETKSTEMADAEDQTESISVRGVHADNESQVKAQQAAGKESAYVRVSIYGEGLEAGESAEVGIASPEKSHSGEKEIGDKLGSGYTTESVLPISITLKDSSGNKVNPGVVNIHAQLLDTSILKEARLFHKTESGAWEELPFTMPGNADKDSGLSYAAFETCGLGELYFVDVEKAEEKTLPETETGAATETEAESIPEAGQTMVNEAKPAAEKVIKTDAETEAETETESENETELKTEMPFLQKTVVNGVTIAVSADPGVFPDGCTMVAKAVSKKEQADINKSVDEAGGSRNVGIGYTFDISVYNKDGNEVQPDNTKGTVSVSFETAQADNGSLMPSVYHTEKTHGDFQTQKLCTEISDGVITARTDGFSYYTVEFTYGDLQYVLDGDNSVLLEDILKAVGISGNPSDANVSDPSLIQISKDGDNYSIKALRKFHTTETLSVCIDNVTYKISVTDSETTAANCYITKAVVKETKDGLGPFDSDDTPGNDSSDSNRIVRSFDSMAYTLEYVTAIKGNDTIDEAKLMVEFTLPFDKKTAQFDLNSMLWLKDAKVTENADGTQTLTGYRLLQNANGANMIPGAGLLSVGVKVGGALNGTKIRPTFKMWMENASDNEKVTLEPPEITVTAAPKYNIALKKSSFCNELGYYDTTTGKESKEKTDGAAYGRMQGYSLEFQLYNNSASKGLKGLEFPKGDISFDLSLKEYVNPNATDQLLEDKEYAPLIWDYKKNGGASSGIYRRNMYLYKINGTQGNWSSPDTDGTAVNQVYNSGNISIESAGNCKYHVTIHDYKVDEENLHFPYYFWSYDSRSAHYYSDNIGVITSHYMQVLLQFPETVTATKNIYLDASVDNISVYSKSGQHLTEDVVKSDNKSIANITLYPSGSISKDIRDVTGNSIWYAADGNQYIGSDFFARSVLYAKYDTPPKALNALFKFDTDGIEIKNVNYVSIVNNKKPETTTFTYLYAAKKDGVGWTDENEMIRTKEEDLIFYKSLSELEAANKTCVGVLWEARHMEAYYDGWSQIANWGFNLKLKDTAVAGHTYGMVEDYNVWLKDTDFERYGHDGEKRPMAEDDLYRSADTNYYVKAEYDENGQMIAGTHAGGHNAGNTILAVGYKMKVTKEVADKDTSGKIKTVYDMDANERVVNFKVTPYTLTDSTSGTQRKTTVYLTDALPKGLTYKDGTSFFGKESVEPEVTKNTNGTTTLRWTLKDVIVGDNSKAVTFACDIGHIGAKDDVNNNDQITNTVSIIGDEYNKPPSVQNGTIATASFSVIKLSALSVSKTTDTPYVNIGDKFRYTFKFANTSANVIKDASLLDVLPYNGDGRNTNFGGSYNVESVVMNFSGASRSYDDYKAGSYWAYMASDGGIRTSDYEKAKSFTGWKNITSKSFDDADKTVTFTNLTDGMKALKLGLSLFGSEAVEVTVNMRGNGGQREGDVYVNSVWEDAAGQSKEVMSNRASVQIYGKIPVTKIWDDDDNSQGSRPDEITINLLQNGHIYKTAALKKTDSQYIFTDIPLYDEKGQKLTYSAEEASVPAGYMSETKQNNPDKETDGFTIKNIATVVTISKKDPSGKAVIGAELAVKDKNGNTVASFTSGQKPEKYTGKFIPGDTYTLTETKAPEGYLKTADVSFIVDEKGQAMQDGKTVSANGIVMTDPYDTKNLTVTKHVAGNMGSRSRFFEFTVDLKGLLPNTQYKTDLSNAETGSGHLNPSVFRSDESGNASVTLYMKDSQSIILKDLAYGTSYTVAETPAGGYTTTSENASGTLKADTEAVFTNRRNMAIPTNAASGGMLPWIFAVAGAAGLLFALQKKKSR